MKEHPIVILPGWLLGSRRFLPLESAFRASGFTKVFILDFPGFEQGEKVFKAWTLSDYVDFLDDFLKVHKLENPIFVAHSFGGRVALKYLYKNKTQSPLLVLSGTPGFRMINTKYKIVSIISKLGKTLKSNLPLPYLREIFSKFFDILVGARDLSKLKGFMRQTFINIVEEDLLEYMQKLSIPTLLIWGENDGIVPVSIAQKMHDTIPNASLVIVPNALHNVPYKKPTEFVDTILKYHVQQ